MSKEATITDGEVIVMLDDHGIDGFFDSILGLSFSESVGLKDSYTIEEVKEYLGY